VNWIKVAKDKAQWRALLNIAAFIKDWKFAERIPASQEGLCSLELQNNNNNNNNLTYQGYSELIFTVSFRCTLGKIECRILVPTALLSVSKACRELENSAAVSLEYSVI
jgi:hypothetical protein